MLAIHALYPLLLLKLTDEWEEYETHGILESAGKWLNFRSLLDLV